jgi:Tfp pilus assembly PilM family ATPase
MNLLKIKSIGLDIADHTIEIVEVKKWLGTFSVTKLNQINLEPGIVSRGRIIDQKKLEFALKKLFASARPNAFVGIKNI